MTNISKKRMKKEVFDSVSKQFVKYISNLKTPEITKDVISELLTDSEKVMLFKRFMAIVMLDRNYSFVEIKKILKLSQATVSKLQRERKRGEFDSILRQIPKKKDLSGQKFYKKQKGRRELSILETILRAGLPPIVGPGRWSEGPYRSAVTKRNEK